MKPFFVYMLECSNGSFYVGQTDDLEVRIAQHETGVFGGHTAALRPLRLVWSQEFVERDEAFWVERKLKGWSRAKKRALIDGDWSSIRALAAPRTGPDTRRCRNADRDRSCFDKLSTSGHSEPALHGLPPEPAVNGLPPEPALHGLPRESGMENLSSARPEPVEGRAVEGRGDVEPARSCFDKLSTSGHSEPAQHGLPPEPALHGLPRESGMDNLSSARPEPVEGRATRGSR